MPYALNEKISIGQRAIVQFGDRKILTGVIANIHDKPPRDHEAKYLLEILDEFPSVTEQQFKLFRWIADYYLCTMGEVMNAALPGGLKLSSESRVQIHPAFNLEESDHAFSEKEIILIKRLMQESLDYSQIVSLLGVKHLYSILKSLVGKEAVILYEEVKEKFKPKTERKIRLTEQYNSSSALESLFKVLESKPKQEAVLLKYLQEVPLLGHPEKNKAGLSKKKLLEGDISESSLSTLIKNGTLEEFDVIVSRFEDDTSEFQATVQLSVEQQQTQLRDPGEL